VEEGEGEWGIGNMRNETNYIRKFITFGDRSSKGRIILKQM
jgi:hypothetical protein